MNGWASFAALFVYTSTDAAFDTSRADIDACAIRHIWASVA